MQVLSGDVVLTAVMLSVSMPALWVVARRNSLRPLGILLFGGVALCVGYFLYIPASPFFVPSDGLGYGAWGFDIAQAWAGNRPEATNLTWPSKVVFPIIIAVLSTISGGPVYVSVITLNCILLCSSVLAIQRSVKSLSGNSQPWATIPLLATSPAILIFGPSMLRESIFWLGISLGVLSITLAREKSLKLSPLLLGVSYVLLVAIRPDLGLFFGAGFALIWAFFVLLGGSKRTRTRWTLFILAAAFLVATSTAFFSYVAPDRDAQSIPETSRALAPASSITSFQTEENSGTGSTSAKTGFCSTSIYASVACEAPKNLLRAVFGPFPSELGPEPIWFVAVTATLHFLVLAILSVYFAISHSGSRAFSWSLVIFGAGTVFVFSSVLTNYGILFRFKAATEWLLLAPGSAGLILASKRLTSELRHRLRRANGSADSRAGS